MKRTTIIIGVVLALLLVVPTSLAIVPPQQQEQQPPLDWPQFNANKFNWNWSPQTVINKENAKFLEIKWTFPIPAAPADPTGKFTAQGSMVTPIVYQGILYFVTNWNRVYALDARNGKTLWFLDLKPPENWLEIFEASRFVTETFAGHYHQIHIWELNGKPYLAIIPQWWHLLMIDPFTGDILLDWPVFSPEEIANVPGNRAFYDLTTPSFIIDTRRNILVIGTGASEEQDSGRGFIKGVDLNPWLEGRGNPRTIWRTFLIPPQDGSDPEWTLKMLEEIDFAWAWDGEKLVDLKALPDDLKRQLFYDDWGFARFVEMFPEEEVSYAGQGAGWGGAYVVDEDRGIVYVGTNQPSPDWNATYRPGPNLWGSSILAIDIESGRLIWGVQTTPNDIWDYDCAWSFLLLKNVMVKGQTRDVLIKGCKNGVLYALNPDTGELFWAFDSGNPAKFGGNPDFGIKRSKYMIFLDPTSPRDMNWRWQGEWTTGDEYEYIKNHGKILQNPPATGGLEMDPTYDPERNYVFLVVYNMPNEIEIGNVGPGTQYRGFPGGAGLVSLGWRSDLANSTVYAIDVNTGRVVWDFFIDKLPYRGGISASNGIVFVPLLDGRLLLLDADNGNVIREIVIGAPFSTAPSIAADAEGEVKLFLTTHGAFSFWAPNNPGFVVALGLPEEIPVIERERVVERTVIQTVEQTVLTTTTETLVTTEVVTEVQEVVPAWAYVAAAIAVVALVLAGVVAARARRR